MRVAGSWKKDRRLRSLRCGEKELAISAAMRFQGSPDIAYSCPSRSRDPSLLRDAAV